jgi:hypothetical protein
MSVSDKLFYNKPNINSNITESNYINGRSGMCYKKIIHRIVFVRHGETKAIKF